MHRVELKAFLSSNTCSASSMFLMHRVELKVSEFQGVDVRFIVPNAPCGVERLRASDILLGLKVGFLMHRVELKAITRIVKALTNAVPNAPCGVESAIVFMLVAFAYVFLMHRVELKGC